MKKASIFMAIAAAASLASCTAQSPKANLKTETDSLSYALGVLQYNPRLKEMMKQQLELDSTTYAAFLEGYIAGAKSTDPKEIARVIGFQQGMGFSIKNLKEGSAQFFGGDSTKVLNQADILAGYIAAFNGKDLKISSEEANAMLNAFQEKMQEDKMQKEFGEYKIQNEKFLAENKTKEGVKTTPSGLQYKVLKEGKGAVPTDTTKVKVNYKGMLIDGTEFDSSYKRNEPFQCTAKDVIKGWGEALTMMPVGSKWELYIPQELAYGSRNMGTIKPYSTLIFEVELVDTMK